MDNDNDLRGIFVVIIHEYLGYSLFRYLLAVHSSNRIGNRSNIQNFIVEQMHGDDGWRPGVRPQWCAPVVPQCSNGNRWESGL